MRCADKLKLLDNLGRFVHIENNASSRNPKVSLQPQKISITSKIKTLKKSHCLIRQRLNCQKAGVLRRDRSPKGCMAMHVLWRVLQRSIPHIMVLYEVDRYCLETSPAERYNERISRLQNLLKPPMLLQPDLHKPYI